MPAAVVKEGDVLAGKYRVERVLGQGGMGQVVAAMHLQLKERVALKFLLPAAAAEPEFAARFQREAQLMAKLRSEHVARVSDVGILETGAPYMVMEYLEGQDLRSILRQTGPLPLDVALDYVLQACEGIAEAHALGIVHRDIKPTNLFVMQRRDGTAVVKVLDFGISKAPDETVEAAQRNDLTGVAAVLGSPRYMPPEQLRSSRDVDARADVWAIAAIFQELLTGDTPFSGPNATALCAAIVGDPPTPLRAKWPEAPEALEKVLLRCFEKETSARMPSISEFAAEIVKAVAPDDPAAVLAAERIARTSGAVPSTLGTTTTGRKAFGLNRSGSFNAAGAGSGPISATPSRLTPPPTTDRTDKTGSGTTTGDRSGTEAKRRRLGIVAGAVVLTAVAILLVVFQGRTAPPSKNVAATPEPTESPSAHVETAPSAPAPVPSPATSASAAPSPNEPPPPASEKTTSTPAPGRGRGMTLPRTTKAEQPPPPSTPPPATAPAPPPKEKSLGNPLDDRQ